MRFFNSVQYQSILSECKHSLSLSLPLMASQLVQASSPFVGTVMVAHLGKAALAASALVTTVFVTLLLFAYGIFSSVTVLVSQNIGRKNDEGVRLTVSQGFILAIGLSLPLMLVMWFAPVAFRLSGQDQDVILLATHYLHALVWCFLPFSFLMVMDQFLIGLSRTQLVLCISLLQVPCEIFFNYAFVFGKFGFPRCGIAGLGYGFTVVFVLSSIGIGLFISHSKVTRGYRVFSHFCRIKMEVLLELLRVGVPVGCMYTIEVGLFLMVVFLMGRLGSDILAAHQITWQYVEFTIALVFAFSQATTVRVGRAVGQGEKSAVKRATYVGISIACALMMLAAIVYLVFPRFIISIDVDIHARAYQELVECAVRFLSIAALFQLFDSIRIVFVGALRGLKDTKAPMYISLFSFWGVGLSLAYFMGFHLRWGGVGIWCGTTAGIIIGVIMLVLRFNYLIKKVRLSDLVM